MEKKNDLKYFSNEMRKVKLKSIIHQIQSFNRKYGGLRLSYNSFDGEITLCEDKTTKDLIKNQFYSKPKIKKRRKEKLESVNKFSLISFKEGTLGIDIIKETNGHLQSSRFFFFRKQKQKQKNITIFE